ncbi:MAG: hypothetical protein KAX49_19910 [Halanaerobiales bacterium]|nr:hypothetical protein [Halanaerobiales bacterium]
MRYCVITLDLIKSRQLNDRKEVQEELKEALKIINSKYGQSLEVPFDFTLGDEVQGVLKNLQNSYPLIQDFQRLFGYHFYTGVGYGEILTKMSERSGAMDGPAFHLAREGVESLKERYAHQHRKNRFIPLIYYSFSDSQLTNLVNGYLQMIELLKYKMTEKQREVYWFLMELDTYSEIADYLNQSKSAITQKIQAGNVEEVRTGEKGFIQFLDWVEKVQKNGGE